MDEQSYPNRSIRKGQQWQSHWPAEICRRGSGSGALVRVLGDDKALPAAVVAAANAIHDLSWGKPFTTAIVSVAQLDPSESHLAALLELARKREAEALGQLAKPPAGLKFRN